MKAPVHTLYLILLTNKSMVFSSLYSNKADSTAVPAETDQIWCGQNGGLNAGANTAYAIRLSPDRFASGAVKSTEI